MSTNIYQFESRNCQITRLCCTPITKDSNTVKTQNLESMKCTTPMSSNLITSFTLVKVTMTRKILKRVILRKTSNNTMFNTVLRGKVAERANPWLKLLTPISRPLSQIAPLIPPLLQPLPQHPPVPPPVTPIPLPNTLLIKTDTVNPLTLPLEIASQKRFTLILVEFYFKWN
ncbi:UNVERIFIED_CONTAM: hypothetical protein GTU68_014261 [Idotea baltica]|nr:hypothetical protein [Idotea baltica]